MKSIHSPSRSRRGCAESGSPLVQGAESFAVWYESSPAFAVEGGGARVLLRYPARNPLLSGWLIGPEKIQGLGALAEATLGNGRVVLFGFRPQYRAQSWGTYVLFLNALFDAAVERTAAGTGDGTGTAAGLR